MTKLLIADDEPLVQIGLKSMIPWDSLDIEICGTAVNGAAALKIIEEYSPEIVITDIRMPVMSGLELAKICQERFGEIPLFIILTSYEEFSLAKEALACRVSEYLVKLELMPKLLTEAVARCQNHLLKLHGMMEQNHAGLPLLQSFGDKFFMRLLHNLFENEQQFWLQAEDLHLNFSGRQYLAAHCAVHEMPGHTMEQSKLLNLHHSSLQIFREILQKHLPCYVIPLDFKYFAVIFHWNTDMAAVTDTIAEALSNACSMVYKYFNVWIAVGAGAVTDHPLKISDSYQDARLSYARTTLERQIVYISQLPPETHRDSFNISVFKNELTRAFEEFDAGILDQTLREINELFVSHPRHYLQAVDGACSILYMAMNLLPDGEQTINDLFSHYAEGYRSIYRFNNVVQIADWMTALRTGLINTLRARRKTYKDHAVTSVQKYIKSHLSERIELNETASVFSISPSYLSMLFKKNCGTGFNEYVNQLKIARAKQLLLEENMRVYEVAGQLGYENAFYFSKVFKKAEGISPREYMQLNSILPDQLEKPDGRIQDDQ